MSNTQTPEQLRINALMRACAEPQYNTDSAASSQGSDYTPILDITNIDAYTGNGGLMESAREIFMLQGNNGLIDRYVRDEQAEMTRKLILDVSCSINNNSMLFIHIIVILTTILYVVVCQFPR